MTRLESLQHACWFGRLCTFYKIFKNQSSRYHNELLLLQTTSHNTSYSRNIPLFHFKHDSFKNLFQDPLLTVHIIALILRVLNILRLRFRLGLSHLLDHKFKHGSLDSLNAICSCGFDIERNCHSLLHCLQFYKWKIIPPENTLRLTKDELPTCHTWVIKLFFYGNDLLDLETSTLILNVFVGFI